jgi:hypothetical protein
MDAENDLIIWTELPSTHSPYRSPRAASNRYGNDTAKLPPKAALQSHHARKAIRTGSIDSGVDACQVAFVPSLVEPGAMIDPEK